MRTTLNSQSSIKKVNAIVVNWNGGEKLLTCLESLFNSKGVKLTVHLVDNGSVDGSANAAKRKFLKLKIHKLNENKGFAAGVNIGIKAALRQKADFMFLLNNDATIKPNTIRELLSAAERDPNAGLYGGKIITPDKKIWCCGMAIGFWNWGLRGNGQKDKGQYSKKEPVDALTGCGIMVSQNVFKKIGLFSEEYFAYVEDEDFCTRANKAGFHCLYVPTSTIIHEGSSSTGGGYTEVRKYLMAHGNLIFLRNHGTLALWTRWLILDVIAYPFLTPIAALKGGNLKGYLAKGKGTLDGILRKPADLTLLEKK